MYIELASSGSSSTSTSLSRCVLRNDSFARMFGLSVHLLATSNSFSVRYNLTEVISSRLSSSSSANSSANSNRALCSKLSLSQKLASEGSDPLWMVIAPRQPNTLEMFTLLGDWPMQPLVGKDWMGRASFLQQLAQAGAGRSSDPMQFNSDATGRWPRCRSSRRTAGH